MGWPAFRSIAGAATLAAIVCTAPASSASVRPPKLTYDLATLPNGLRVVFEEDHSTPIAHVQLWYHVGSKNERPGRTGFAHLFEHLMFKGSKNVQPEEHTSVIASIGGQSNAYTEEDATVFWETVPSQYLPLVLWLEADRMATLRIDKETFTSEREVVKEERRMRIDNQPYGNLNELLYDQAFTTHPYKHPTIGSMTDLEAASVDDVRDFYQTYYVPENATLVLVGDFDLQQARQLVTQYLGRVPKAPNPVPRDIPKEPPQTAERRVTVREPWPLPAVAVAYHVTYDGHPDSYPLHIASKILTDGESSRIYQKLVYEKQIAVAAFGQANLIEDPNLFYCVAIVQPGHTPEEAAAALIAELDRLKNEEVSDHELQRSKNQFARDYILGRESDQQKALQLAHAVVIHNDITTADGEFDIFQSITAADVQRVARTYFTPENRTVLTVMPAGAANPGAGPMTRRLAVRAAVAALVACCAMLGASAVSAQARWPSEGPPGPLQAHAVQFPPYEVRTLPNGLQVVAVLHHEQPVVSMRLIVRAGSALDPRDKAGLAHLMASLLDQGTTTMSALEINDAVDFIGGDLNAGAGTDLSFLRMVVMKDSFEFGLHTLSDMARHPAFAPEEIERQRQQIVSTLQVKSQDPEYIANSVFDRLVYGLHPYGLPDTGTPRTLAAITRSDIASFHDRYFAPNNAILAVVGDLSTEEAFDGVAKAFGDWEKRDVAVPSFTAPPQPARRVIVVNKPDAVQTEIRVGHIGVKRNTSDFMSLNLALRILGGEGANRLHQVLRTERSLTYGAQAEMDTLRDAGDFEAKTNTRTEATGEVVRLIVDEFWRIQRERVSERELADAKAYLTGSFPLTIETPDAIATQVLNVLFFGLPVRELQSFRDRVNAVSVDDIERVSRYYLHPDRLAIVLVGNAAAFTPQLRRIGLGTFETVEAADLDLMTADFKPARGGAAAPPPAGRPVRLLPVAYAPQSNPAVVAQEGNAAQALLDKVIAAKGGLDVLRGVKNITAVTHADTDTPNGRVDAQTTTYLEYPNRVRVETSLPGESIVQGYDGARAWVKDARGVHDVPAAMARQLDTGFSRDVIALLLAAHDGKVRPRLLPDVKAEDGRTYHVLECSSPSLEPTILYVDPATNLVARQSYVAGGPAPGGRPSDRPIVDESFSDYREVSGVQVAFTAVVRQAGQRVLERRVTSIRINDPIDFSLFKRPAS